MNSLFDQMRISGGKAQNNYRPGGGAQNAGWNQRRNYTNHQGKNQVEHDQVNFYVAQNIIYFISTSHSLHLLVCGIINCSKHCHQF